MTGTNRPKLFMFEGPDGTGKTTQIELARSALEALGHNVITVRGHGGTPIGEELRIVSLGSPARPALGRAALTDLYLSRAMHAEITETTLKDARPSDVILLDRGSLSMWAYQVFASGLEAQRAEATIDSDLHDFDPTLIFCLKASLETIRTRMRASGSKADYFESMGDDYFERVIAGYDFAAARYGALVIDAEPSEQIVHEQTLKAIQDAL